MGITYKLTLAPISEGTPSQSQSINVEAQLTSLRTPARAQFESVENFVEVLGDFLPKEQANSTVERLHLGETVVLSQPIPREVLLSMKFDFI